MKKTVLIGMLIAVKTFASDPVGANTEIRVIAEAQQEIMHIVGLLNTTNYAHAGESPAEAVSRVATGLMDSDQCSVAQMLSQLAIAYTKEEESHGYTKELVTIRVVMGHVLMEITPEEIMSSIAPYYERVDDDHLKQNYEHMLDMATIRKGRRNPNFKPFTSYFESHKENPPKQLT